MKFMLVWIALGGAPIGSVEHPSIEYASMDLCQAALINLTPPEERTEEMGSHLPGWFCIGEADL